MKKAMEVDLVDLAEILEGFTAKLAKLSQTDLIDLAARLKPVAKHVEAIDKFTKDFVKEKLHEKEGAVPGSMFKAELKLVPITRLNQAALKEAEPKLYEEYSDEKDEVRITFSTR